MIPSTIKLTSDIISEHLPTLNDKARNTFYYEQINKHAQDKVVVDVGTGTGLLAFYALAAGAKFVYCIDSDPDICKVADSILSTHFDKTKFQVINADFWKNQVSDVFHHPIDMLINDTSLPGHLDIGILKTWEVIQSFVSPGYISLPDRIHCDVKVWKSLLDVTPSIIPNDYIFYKNSVLTKLFEDTLIQIDQDNCTNKMQIKNYQQNPTHLKSDYFFNNVVSFTRQNTIPNEISFEISITVPTTISIISNMSCLGNSLFQPLNWKVQCHQSPLFVLPVPGNYRLQYNNWHALMPNEIAQWELS